jgi:hypothetical protein
MEPCGCRKLRDQVNRRLITVGTASISQLGTAGLIAGGSEPAAALARQLAAKWLAGERSDSAWLMTSSGIAWRARPSRYATCDIAGSGPSPLHGTGKGLAKALRAEQVRCGHACRIGAGGQPTG